MKKLLSSLVFIIGIIPLCAIFAQDKQILSDKPIGQYDKSKVQQYTLPDPLLMVNGERVKDTAVWNGRRRREILEMFETYVYGKATVNRPEGMHWETTAEDRSSLNDSDVTKKVTIYFSRNEGWPKLETRYNSAKNRETSPCFPGVHMGSRCQARNQKRIRSRDI